MDANTCPTCGSDCNERDELTKAEREITRPSAEVDALKRTHDEAMKRSHEVTQEMARQFETEVEALRADAQAVAALLPGPYYMDPPDGGSVTVIEQLRRMAADAARYRWIKRGASFREERDMGPGGCWSIFVAVPRRPAVNSHDTAIDAAMAQVKV